MEIRFGALPRLLAVHLYNLLSDAQVALTVHLPSDVDPASEQTENVDEWAVTVVYDEEPGWARVEADVQSRVGGIVLLDCTLDGRAQSAAGTAGTSLVVRLRGDATSTWVEPHLPPPVPDVLSRPVRSQTSGDPEGTNDADHAEDQTGTEPTGSTEPTGTSHSTAGTGTGTGDTADGSTGEPIVAG